MRRLVAAETEHVAHRLGETLMKSIGPRLVLPERQTMTSNALIPIVSCRIAHCNRVAYAFFAQTQQPSSDGRAAGTQYRGNPRGWREYLASFRVIRYCP